MNKLSHGYKTSKDYVKLFELVKTQRIACFVNYGKDEDGNYKRQDICQSQIVPSDKQISIGARGVEYITAFQIEDMTVKEDFIAQCIAANLEFIDPVIDIEKMISDIKDMVFVNTNAVNKGSLDYALRIYLEKEFKHE